MQEKPALLIIDMLKDYFQDSHPLPITVHARKIVAPINNLISAFRSKDWPIVFATDAFDEDDFLFKGKMRPHAIKGTQGAEPIDQLDRRPSDLWLPKPRFSAFFNTDLDLWLKNQGVTLCAVAGIATNFCVLSTAFDAVCHNFKTVILEDCSAAASPEIHQTTLSLYRKNPISPLLQVMDSNSFLIAINEQKI